MANLPYVTSTGNIARALEGIASAATPERVSQDFVKTILGVKGGSGDQMTSFLKKIGFANPDGSPTGIYKSFRNSGTRGAAAAQSLRIGYEPLFKRNEYMYQLSDEKLKGLIIEQTGVGEDSTVPGLILASIKTIKKFANFDHGIVEEDSVSADFDLPTKTLVKARIEDLSSDDSRAIGMNLSYTINLNLPATSDIAVFNAIFKSLRDNLLQRGD